MVIDISFIFFHNLITINHPYNIIFIEIYEIVNITLDKIHYSAILIAILPDTSPTRSQRFKKKIITMPNLQSAKKALRQSKKRAVENLVVKKSFKSAVKKVLKGLDNDVDVTEDLKLAQKKLDKAVKKGVIKKGAASRKISRLTKKVSSVKK